MKTVVGYKPNTCDDANCGKMVAAIKHDGKMKKSGKKPPFCKGK